MEYEQTSLLSSIVSSYRVSYQWIVPEEVIQITDRYYWQWRDTGFVCCELLIFFEVKEEGFNQLLFPFLISSMLVNYLFHFLSR